MITKKDIKEFARSLNKKLSKDSLTELDKQVSLFIKNKLKEASTNAEFKGRKIILSEDLTK